MNSALRLENDNGLPQLPLILRWHEADNPLPVCAVKRAARIGKHGRSAAAAHTATCGGEAPPWLYSGAPERPFDFCTHIQRLCSDIVACSADLAHIDMSRLLIAVTQARSSNAHGLQARVTPMRFRAGSLTRRRRQVVYQVQRYCLGNCEILYLVTFCLPRFLDLSFDEKTITLFHELYHISPDFDGDLRRHGGRYSVHSHSQHLYDQHMAALAREYLSLGPDARLHDFLRMNFAQLQDRHGSVVGVRVPRPRLVPICVPAP